MKDRALFIAGLSFWWLLIRKARRIIDSALAPETFELASFLLGATILVCGIAFVVAGRALSASRVREKAKLGTAALGIATSASLLVCALCGAMGGPLPIVAAVLTAATYACLGICWAWTGLDLARCSERKTLAIDIALSYLVSVALNNGLFELMPSSVETLYGALGPVVSAALLLAQARRLRRTVPGTEERGEALPMAPTFVAKPRVETLVGLAAVSVFIVLTSALIGTFTDDRIVSGSRDAIGIGISIGFAVLIVACVAVANRAPGFLIFTWGFALLAVIFGVLLAFSHDEALIEIGSSMLYTGRAIVWLLLWILLMGLARTDGLDEVGLIGGFHIAPHGLSLVVSTFVSGAVPLGSLSESSFYAIALVATLVLIAGALVITGHLMTMGQVRTYAPPEQQLARRTDEDARRDACADIAKQHGLTERETIVLEGLSQGFTMQHIADLQFVSQNTVRTHVKGIYRKIGCHSKQEVIELVNARMA